MLYTYNKYDWGNKFEKLRNSRYKENSKRFHYCKTLESFSAQINAEKVNKEGVLTKISRQTLSSWINGKTIPTINQLSKICNLLQCDVDYFLTDTPNFEKDIFDISKVTGLDEIVIRRIRSNPSLQRLLNHVITSERFPDIENAIYQDSNMLYVTRDFLNGYSLYLQNKLHNAYNKFYSMTFPLDRSKNTFKDYLRLEIPYKKINTNVLDFLEKHLNDDHYNQIQIQIKCNHIHKQEHEKIYDLFINDIVTKLYDTLEYRYNRESILITIAQSVVVILDEYIEKEATLRNAYVLSNIEQGVKNE